MLDTQRKMLYVHDPAALYQIVIKDPYTFEPLAWFTSLVYVVSGVLALVTKCFQVRFTCIWTRSASIPW